MPNPKKSPQGKSKKFCASKSDKIAGSTSLKFTVASRLEPLPDKLCLSPHLFLWA
jgi:hypothetical protein